MLCRRHCRIPFSFVSSTSSNELGGPVGALRGRPQFSTMIRPSCPLGAHTRLSGWKDFFPAKELLLVFSRTLAGRALVGRSNVGKSPLINALVNRNEMAHTSKSPGKTQLINHFRINKRWYLVDLPGYGLSQRLQGASSSRCIEDSRRSLRACYSSVSPGDRNVDIFDRVLKTKHRDRAAWLMKAGDPLLERVTENLLDRLDDCRRTFPTALNLGGASHQVHRLIGRRGGVEKMITVDLSKDMIEKSAQLRATEANGDISSRIEDMHVVADEEFLPFGEGCFDVVLSSLGLHWVNDLPGAMTQCRLALKEDGLFLGAMLGGETLKELRIACTLAQMEREGGISPRISPLAQVRDAGNLLQRAGLALPTIDVDEFTVRYPCALDLIHHLRTMGEVNAVRERNLTLKKDTALATAALYESMFGDADGTVPATFQVIYMTGWRPSPSQQTPKRRGSANASFHDLQKAFAPAEDGSPKSGSQ